MAKNKKDNKKEIKKFEKKQSTEKKNLFPQEIGWIIKIFLIIFITLSIFSHNYLDNSFNRISEDPIKNYFGIMGSYFSDIIFQLFGVISYLIPIFFPIYYIKKQFFKNKSIFYTFNFQTILTITIISSLITIYPIYDYQSGIIGSLLTLGLTSILNDIGATILLSSVLLSLSILMYEIPIKRLTIAFIYFTANIFLNLFLIIKTHLKELKNSTDKYNQNETASDIKMDKDSKQKKDNKNKKPEDIIEEYDNIKMEKLKIKEEIKLEKQRLKLDKIKQKQEEKERKRKQKMQMKISKQEELIIEELFEEYNSKDDSIASSLKDDTDSSSIKMQGHASQAENKDTAPTSKNKPHASQAENKDTYSPLEDKSNTSQSEDISPQNLEFEEQNSKPFVMYSKVEVLDEIIEIPPTPNETESNPPKIKFQNFEKILEEESKDEGTASSLTDGIALPLTDGIASSLSKDADTSHLKNESKDANSSHLKKEAIEIKVAKKTDINNFNNFETSDNQEKTNYKLPPLEYLKFEEPQNQNIDESYLVENARLIIECLADFNINDAKVKEIFQGPTLTTYEVEIKRGIQISKVIKFTDEIATMLKVSGVRMVSIPEKGVIGVEVPNKKREIVWLKEIIASEEYKKAAKKSKLTVVLGKDISGEPIIANLAKMPHLLIAGTTGSGKSVFNNVLITSILYNATPDEVKFILIDPKMLEFSLYNDIPNLLFPVIIDPKKAAHALNWAVDEMERRYMLISEHSERDIVSYNDKAKKTIAEGPSQEIQNKINEYELLSEEILRDNSITEEEKEKEIREIKYKIANIKDKFANPEILPYIVIVLDEYADLMMVAGKNVEISISRIAQKARAAGIHLVIATQRPDKDVVTGIIKANLPVRVALSVKGSTNSKIILDSIGAEKLLGHGDLLYLGPGTSNLNRIQSPLVTSDEQKKVLDFLREQGKPTYSLDLLNQYDEGDDDGFTEILDEDKDDKYEEAIQIAIEMKQISASYLQRRLKLGYNRAARIVEVMEKEGIVGPPNGSKPRKVIITEYR